MIVLRKPRYGDSLNAIQAHIARGNPSAAVDLWLHIDEQVDRLADPNFPRRLGRVPGTLELVAHENYIVVLEQFDDTVLVLDVIHAAQQYP